ncbi:hypothetical protein AWB99_17270 [Mycolicibacterium confluentis]|uniref:Uncharacterized protein n=1 Tax=Mycolicibacterium confluentis TaxID=28047 RepID=A0A7I7XQG3_9MYCO|nr:hypothetical protein AWB99_17270 [Mycolicibacterium confluentis]BBZ31440.1 hypothetical protein MCNF_00450 [Mycolicibacterium confluentis]
MVANALRIGHLPHAHLPSVPALAHQVAHGCTVCWHGLANAATVGVAPESHRRPVRAAYLERAEMTREITHL